MLEDEAEFAKSILWAEFILMVCIPGFVFVMLIFSQIKRIKIVLVRILTSMARCIGVDYCFELGFAFSRLKRLAADNISDWMAYYYIYN